MAKKTEYGINLNPQHSAGQPQDVKVLQGVKWVRLVFQLEFKDNVHWSVDKGFDFYDPLIINYRQVGARPLLILNQETLWGNGPWDHGGWDIYARDFAKRAGQIAAHYKSQNVAYEIWNEGDIVGESSVFIPADRFAGILDQAAAAIKAEDPAAEIVFGGLASGAESAIQYVEKVRQALNNKLPVDAIGIHPYGQWPPSGKPDLPTGWFAPLKATLNRYTQAFSGIPIWITEIGVSEPGQIKPQHWSKVADYMDGVLTLVKRNYAQAVPVVIWFAWSDVMRDAGIVDSGGTPKQPIYRRFFEFARAKEEVQIPSTGVLTPTGANLRVREGAGYQFGILTSVNPGDRLEALEAWETVLPKLGRRRQWVHVRAPNGEVGWSVARYLKLIEDESATPPAVALTPTGDNLWVREGAGRQFKIITGANPGDRLEALEEWDTVLPKLGRRGQWVHVRAPNGEVGWSAARYLKLIEDESATPPAVALTPTGANLWVREGAGRRFKIITGVNPGDRLEALEAWETILPKLGRRGQWVHVRAPNGEVGWSAARYLKLAPQEE